MKRRSIAVPVTAVVSAFFSSCFPGWASIPLLMLYPSRSRSTTACSIGRAGRSAAAPFVGLDNFRELFNDPVVGMALGNNARVLLLNWVFQLPIALLLAFTLAGLRHGRRAYRFLFFIPVILPVATLALLWRLHLLGQPVRTAQQRPARPGHGKLDPAMAQRRRHRAVDHELSRSLAVHRLLHGDLPGRAGRHPGGVLRGRRAGRRGRLAPAHRHHPARASNLSMSPP